RILIPIFRRTIMAASRKEFTGLRTRPPVIAPGQDLESVTDKISSIVLTKRTGSGWLIGFAIAFALVMVLLWSVTYLFARGVGIWGINVPVAWGFAIICFVWW